MLDLAFYSSLILFFFFLEFFYFHIAKANNIVDVPNNRSSHSHLTIRGGGIIFPISVISWAILNEFQYPFFCTGLLLISAISFWDDIKAINTYNRFIFQAFSIIFLIFETQLDINWYWYVLILLFITGIVNAWNFMDGINGITGGYSLVTLVTLWYINDSIIAFINGSFILFVILSLLVFNFFNFRPRAKCFAGDVGSVGIAFVICFLLLLLISTSGNLTFLGFILIYGLDTGTTIFFRLIRKENILEAHRSHFYQFLANEKRIAHLSVAMLYSMLQIIINILISVAHIYLKNSLLFLIVTIVLTTIIFILIRLSQEGYKRLFAIRDFKQA